MRFFDSAIESIHSELLLLAPVHLPVPSRFWRTRKDPAHHADLLRQVQRLRGRIYLEDGAVEASQLTPDGRHHQPMDAHSWHLVAMDEYGGVCGCARYSHYTQHIGFQDLSVRNSAMARCSRWGGNLRAAVECELAEARRRGVAFAEVGGWAVAPEKRSSPEALRIALATYGLAQLLGGCLGLSTATIRHRSSTILRRLGGRSLAAAGSELPPYFDPQYACQMEVLRFDSDEPNSTFRAGIERLRRQLPSVTVVAAPPPALNYPGTLRPIPVLDPLPWPAQAQFG